MDKVNENCEDIAEVIQVAGGEVGKPGGAKSGVQSVSFVAAGVPRHEAGEETDWTTMQKRVTRGAGRQRKILADKGPLKQNIFQFYADKSKKCEPETPIQIYEDKSDQVEELRQLRDLVLQMVQQLAEVKEEQGKMIKFLDQLHGQVKELLDLQAKDKAIIQSLEEAKTRLRKDHHQASQASWAKVVSGRTASTGVETTSDAYGKSSELPISRSSGVRRPRAEDDPTAITVITSKWIGDCRDYNTIKEICQATISSFKALKGVKISFLRPLPNDKISFVFSDRATTDKARLISR
ncbi:Hypothetical protein D9617_69g078000 [Elsinoe fawcettii]|nr:Hypothetical protein D9617_69g078000 [Elsinoe fawcettii]